MRGLDDIRKDFPALQQKIHDHDLVYLDNPATTLKPEPVIQSLNHYYSQGTANVHRGIHFLSAQATAQYEQARETIQHFLNVPDKEGEIIFTRGTTESINLVATSWGEKYLKSGDTILLTQMEHHSNLVPWQLVAQKTGAQIKFVPVNDRGELIQTEYLRLLKEGVKMTSLTHVSNTLGTINPLDEMIPLAHSYGSLVCVDAAQSAPHLPLDVGQLDCDFLTFSGHKMYGPTGIGILYGKRKLLDIMPPYQGGGAMVDEVTFEQSSYQPAPQKFEAGTPPIAEAIALAEAAQYTKNLPSSLLKTEEELLEAATNGVKDIPSAQIIGEADDKIGILSFVIQGMHSQDIGMILDQQGVAARVGHHCTSPLLKHFNLTSTVRIGFACYNNEQDVEAFIKALHKARELLQ